MQRLRRRLLLDRALDRRPHVQITCGDVIRRVGEPPDRRAQIAGAARGYDFAGQQARKLARDDFERFDLILAMDRGHHDHLSRQAPEGAGDIRLFLEFAPETGHLEVPDPYYGGTEDYDLALDLIEAGCRGIVAMLQEREAVR